MQKTLNDELKYELSKYLTSTELDRLERTKLFFEKVGNNKDILILLSQTKRIPIKYLELVMQGSIIPNENILEILEEYIQQTHDQNS